MASRTSPVGMTVRTARIRANMTQRQLGAASAISQAKISRIECGRYTPDTAERRALAKALEITAAELGVGGESEDDDMRRRNLLSAGIGVGAAVLPATSAAAPGPGWDTALFRSPTGPSMTTAQISSGLATTARDCGAARYREAAAAIPALIISAEAHSDYGSSGAILLTRAYALATAIAVKERREMAWITADRAVQAARLASHPLAHALAARAQFSVLRQHGHHQWARQLCDTTVSELAGEERARPVVGHLLLEGAYGAAQAGQRSDAIALWEHGRELGRRGPAAVAWPEHAGPLTADQVERYGLCMHHLLGDTRSALRHLRAIDVHAMPTAERRARLRHDSAKLYRDLGDLPKALAQLQDQEEETPQDTRRYSVRTMVASMAQTSPALPGLRPFAERIGAA